MKLLNYMMDRFSMGEALYLSDIISKTHAGITHILIVSIMKIVLTF